MDDFIVLEHTADLKIKVFGKTLEELFINALKGMFQSLKPKATGCSYKNNLLICPALPKKHTITLTSPDHESLLVDFLSEALYLSDSLNEAYLDANIINLTENQIQAKIFGIAIQGFENVEIKAVTYHDLEIKHHEGLWQTDIVFDI